jgi:hypothetical protein
VAGTLSRSAAGFEREFVLTRLGEHPSLGDKLSRFFGAVSTVKTMMAQLALATGPRLGRMQVRLGHRLGCMKGKERRG